MTEPQADSWMVKILYHDTTNKCLSYSNGQNKITIHGIFVYLIIFMVYIISHNEWQDITYLQISVPSTKWTVTERPSANKLCRYKSSRHFCCSQPIVFIAYFSRHRRMSVSSKSSLQFFEQHVLSLSCLMASRHNTRHFLFDRYPRWEYTSGKSWHYDRQINITNFSIYLYKFRTSNSVYKYN